MNKKRGRVLALVFVAILILILPLIFAEDSRPDPERPNLVEATSFPEMEVHDLEDCAGFGACTPGVRYAYVFDYYRRCQKMSAGCTVRLYNNECGDDRACMGYKEGLIVTKDPHRVFIPEAIVAGSRDDETAYVWCKRVYMDDGNQYVCSNNQNWKRCSQEEVNKIAVAAGYIYICRMNDGNPGWENADADHDGYLNDGNDCSDNPSKDPTDIVCPTIDPDSLVGKTIPEIKANARTICSDKIFSRCSLCINPGATEVCGDKINNDCGGSTNANSEELTNVEGKTSDNCNDNQFACELTRPTARPGEPEPQNQDNIYHEKFSWMLDSAGKGYCCGYNGIEDNGKVLSDSDLQQHLCLNKNLVRGVGDISDANFWGAITNAETGDRTCQGDWCWINYN